MKTSFLTASAFLTIAGCATIHLSKNSSGCNDDEAADHSSSPISREQAVAIAKPQVIEHEHWRDELPIRNHITHAVSYTARRINKGKWRVVAHSAIRENRPDGGGGSAYDPIPAAVIVIDKQGHVISYSHSSDPYLD